MKTLADYDSIHQLITAYRQKKEKLERATCICGGTLHYAGHRGSDMVGSEASVARIAISKMRHQEAVNALLDLRTFAPDLEDEMTALNILLQKSYEGNKS